MGYADLHIHTTATDGVPTIQQLLDFVAAQRPELDVIAITDHDVLDSAFWALDHQDDYPFDIIPGMEVSSRAGHILALWVTTPIPHSMDLQDTASAIKEAGGISVLAHPFHFHMGLIRRNAKRYYQTPEVLLEAGIDALEVHNAGVATPFSNRLARRVGASVDIAVLGNSDAHTLGAIGTGKTRFSGTSADDLRTALLNKQTIAEGRPWHLSDYIEFLKHKPDWTPVTSLATVNSSQPTNR